MELENGRPALKREWHRFCFLLRHAQCRSVLGGQEASCGYLGTPRLREYFSSLLRNSETHNTLLSAHIDS